jgi:endoglycosylceramidase
MTSALHRCAGTALVLLAVGAPAAQAAPAPPLNHAGRWITDAQGRVVNMHGLNMVYKRPPYFPAAIGFDEPDAAFLAAEGYNTVRVGIIYAGVEPQPGVYDDAYLARIRETVDVLARHGIHSMLDFHQDLYNERFFGEGWPAWGVRDDDLPNQPNFGFPWNYPGMPALQRAFDHFWMNDPANGDTIGLQDRYAAAWRHVASRFRDHPYVMGYDLMNEPWPGSTWQQCAQPVGCPEFDARMAGFIRRTLAAIRQVDRVKLVWYEPHGLFNFGAATNVGDPGDAHSGFSFHDYCLTTLEGQDPKERDCDAYDDLVFRNALDQASRTGDTLLLTEFGATDDLGSIRRMLDRADRNMVSWQWWHYCGCNDPTTSGPGDTQAIVLDPAKAPAGANVVNAKLAVLSRPYPQAVAGTPLGWRFDPAARTLLVEHTTRRAGGGSLPAGAQTEIVLRRRQYSGGYSAEVDGGAIASRAGDDVLRVVPCSGAPGVVVRVTPGGNRLRGTCELPARFTFGAVPRPLLRISVRPHSTVARRATRFTFTVTIRRNRRNIPVRGSRVRFWGRTTITDRLGRAVTTRTIRTPRRYFAKARLSGYRTSNPVTVTVRPRPARRR